MTTTVVSQGELQSLKELEKDDVIVFTCGEGPSTFTYRFEVKKKDILPECLLTQTNSAGVSLDPQPVRLVGTGRWTTWAQNPVQQNRLGKMMTISYGYIFLGGLIIVSLLESGKLFELQPPCREISLET